MKFHPAHVNTWREKLCSAPRCGACANKFLSKDPIHEFTITMLHPTQPILSIQHAQTHPHFQHQRGGVDTVEGNLLALSPERIGIDVDDTATPVHVTVAVPRVVVPAVTASVAGDGEEPAKIRDTTFWELAGGKRPKYDNVLLKLQGCSVVEAQSYPTRSLIMKCGKQRGNQPFRVVLASNEAASQSLAATFTALYEHALRCPTDPGKAPERLGDIELTGFATSWYKGAPSEGAAQSTVYHLGMFAATNIVAPKLRFVAAPPHAAAATAAVAAAGTGLAAPTAAAPAPPARGPTGSPLSSNTNVHFVPVLPAGLSK